VTPAVEPPKISDSSLRRELRLRDLVLFNICAVASLRWIAAAAHAGPGSLVLWVLAAAFFFVPSALVVARLSARFPEVGGLYIWTKRAFGDGHAFLCSWFYFVSDLLYLPSLVLSGVAMTSFVFGSAGQRFAEDRGIVVPATLIVLWGGFLANFLGLRVAKWISAFGGSALFITVAVLSLLAIVSVFRFGSVTHFDLIPSAHFETLNFWSQIAFAFVGLELAPILSGEIQNPAKNVRLAAGISGVGCCLFYICGTASMLALDKPAEISPMSGLAQTGVAAALKLGMPSIGLVFALLIGLGFIGQLDAWIAGNTRLPYAIGLDRYLPAAFARLHPRWGTPYVSLAVQLVVATSFLLMAQLGESLRSAYDLMVDMTVLATLIPFVYIFGAGLRFAGRIVSFSGLLVTILAIVLTMVPPGETASPVIFETKAVGGCAVFAAVGYLVFKRCDAERTKRLSVLARAAE
jgi:amino acid transporter